MEFRAIHSRRVRNIFISTEMDVLFPRHFSRHALPAAAHFFSFLRVSPVHRQRRRGEEKKNQFMFEHKSNSLEFVQKSRFICLSIEQIVQTNRCFLRRGKKKTRKTLFCSFEFLVFHLENNISAILALNCINRDDVVGGMPLYGQFMHQYIRRSRFAIERRIYRSKNICFHF